MHIIATCFLSMRFFISAQSNYRCLHQVHTNMASRTIIQGLLVLHRMLRLQNRIDLGRTPIQDLKELHSSCNGMVKYLENQYSSLTASSAPVRDSGIHLHWGNLRTAAHEIQKHGYIPHDDKNKWNDFAQISQQKIDTGSLPYVRIIRELLQMPHRGYEYALLWAVGIGKLNTLELDDTTKEALMGRIYQDSALDTSEFWAPALAVPSKTPEDSGPGQCIDCKAAQGRYYQIADKQG